jgi:hypothetical protein
MAKCKRCGKNYLFQKLSDDGNCNNCQIIIRLEKEENTLNNKITEEKSALVEIGKEYSRISDNKELLYSQIKEKAKTDAINEVELKIKNRINDIERLTKEAENKKIELEELLSQEKESLKLIEQNSNKLKKMTTLYKSMQYSVKKCFEDVVPYSEIANSEKINEADELLSTTVKMKFHLMDIRELKKQYSQNNKLIKELLLRYQTRYTTKANISIYRLMVIALEAEFQNVLYNLSYSKLDKAIDDIKKITLKYQKIATDGNQNIAITINKFIGEIEYLYVEAIKIEYEYYIQKERIKEEQKAIKDQMRQEAAERKLLEAEKKKVEQEESKYENEIINIQKLMKEAENQDKINQLEERLAKVQEQLNNVEKKKEGIINLQNGKAGYIYVISNLGSFGDSVFKVGMTRRLDPQDRVDELGDASVPFKFDVHSFIFSDNAPDLELKLHKQLNNQRLNKVNLRKEFFKSSIDELEELVYSLEPSAEFNKTMLAEQFYQSMAVEEVPESVSIIDDDDDEIDEEEVE